MIPVRVQLLGCKYSGVSWIIKESEGSRVLAEIFRAVDLDCTIVLGRYPS